MKSRTIFTLLMVLTLALGSLVGCEPQVTQDTEFPEILMQIWTFLVAFFAGYPLAALLLLVFVDWGLGVFCAIRKKRFKFDKVANFYVTNVIPYVGGYTVIYIAVQVASTQLNGSTLGPYIYLFSAPMLAMAWGILLLKLGNSIAKHVKDLGYEGIQKAT